MDELISIEEFFDSFLHQMLKGLSHESYEKGTRYMEFEQVKEWKSKYGYRFSIYGNDHFIDGKPHFHFDHKEKGIACKVGFDGEVFECQGKESIPSKVLKELKYYLSKESHRSILKKMWNDKNPTLVV
ncbi:MAG: hypothetical protein ACJA1C_001034 [Crocinitomicaceae bacterium]|jgi:hypothetical protein